MIYQVNDTVIISTFGILKVGKVTERVAVKAGNRYIVEVESGKIYDNVFTSPGDGTSSFINKSLTLAYKKQK
tara:strand:+ start:535 stop:750 length:216 start_codon:yes stop_codon:yes gene_type:complete